MALLLPLSDGGVFVDMEGFPYAERGLGYLLGAVTADEITPAFHDWWAHDEAEERIAFEAFVDWVVARWRRDPSLHVYHYAPYETSAVKRLMGKYATREAEVDELLRHGVFVDLYAVVRQGFVVGTPIRRTSRRSLLLPSRRPPAYELHRGELIHLLGLREQPVVAVPRCPDPRWREALA